MGQRSSESEEWAAQRVASWVETYKKSMLTPVILHIVSTQQPVTINAVSVDITRITGWQVTERGLYRTLKRLEDAGLLASVEASAPRTGAKRKELSISPLGASLLAGMTANLITLPDADEHPSPGSMVDPSTIQPER